MTPTADIFSICIIDLAAATMLCMVALSCRWILREKDLEHGMLRAMIGFALVSCILDPICFGYDGVPGFGSFLVVYGTNLYLYSVNLFMTMCWLVFLLQHLFGYVSKRQKIFIGLFTGFGAVALLANFFVPVVFSVDAGNVYHREPLYALFVVLQTAAFIDSMLVYYIARRQSGALRFFPVHLVVVPCVVGAIIQIANFGVSTIWPFIAVSVTAVMIGLQNELIYRDHLTGLYNRAFLDVTLRRKIEKNDYAYAGIMIDVNDFKALNDTMGHAEGDAVLIELADFLRKAVGMQGVAVRYAGDEFVVMLNTRDADEAEAFIELIKGGVVALGKNRSKPCDLSVSAGWCEMDLSKYGVDELLDIIDRRMYENKQAFYEDRI